jgi:hypothetical protein
MVMNRPLAGLALALALVVPSATPANAQTAQLPAGEEFPWSRNVPRKNQDEAQKALLEGNRLMKEFSFAKAEEQYRQALRHWDHPGIHYNLALALLQRDRPIEVHEHMVKALLGGEAALGAEKAEHARLHMATLEKQLAWVEFVCETPGAVVTVEGQPLTLSNGRFKGLMRPGPVTFLATEKHHQPRELKASLSPGQTNSVRLRLYTDSELFEYQPRWKPWKPWTVVGAGTALAAGGGLLYWQARQDYRAFDDKVFECSRGKPESGCREPDLASRRSRVQTLNKFSVGTMALGSAALITGTALVLLNRAEAHRIDADELDRRQGLVVTPVLGGRANGVLVNLDY